MDKQRDEKLVLKLSDEFRGGCLQGRIEIKYEDLVRVFGEPNMGNDGYKVDVEWGGEINGTSFTLYNYKDGENYLGSDGSPVEEITDWHIGGNEPKIAELIHKYVEQQKSYN